MEEKKLLINCAACDARDVKESVLKNYESITVNAAAIFVTPESEELLARYNVNMNTAKKLVVPKNAPIRTVNGKTEIGADSPVEEGTVLIVNGKLVVLSGGENNLKKYAMICVNGKMLCPDDCASDTSKISVNGKLKTYPAGAILMKNDFAVDRLFALRAKAATYWSNLFIFVSPDISPAALAEKGVRFYSEKAVVAESLAEGIVPLINENCDIVIVPDKTAFVSGNLTLDNSAVMRYGTELFVNGNVKILAKGAEALSKLKYLFASGEVTLAKSLEQEFYALKATCRDVKLVNESPAAEITDKISVKIDKRLLEAHPEGISVSDCATVKIAENVPTELIAERLKIFDCVSVLCSEEQESTVSLICGDVAAIGKKGEDGGLFGMFKDAFGALGAAKGTKVVNAEEYKL